MPQTEGVVRVRYGIIGVGLMGREHLMNLAALPPVGNAHAVVTAIADTNDESISKCLSLIEYLQTENAQKVRVFSGQCAAENLFKAEVCDICVISTPNFNHIEIFESIAKCAPKKMHVLCEKPLCTTVEDCRRVIEISNGREGLTLVGLEYSYMPPIARVIKDLRGGVVGVPRMCAIREHRFPFLRKVENWNRLSVNTGGTLVEKCCHFFDLFNRILSPARPSTVYAAGGQAVNNLTSEDPGDILDHAYVTINYCNSSGKVVSRASLDLCMFAEASQEQEEVCIVGDKGKLEAALPSSQVRTGIRDKHSLANVQVECVEDDRIKYYGHHHGSSFLEHLDILEQVQSGPGAEAQTSQTAGLEQGLLSVAIGVAAHVSIGEGRIVDMKEVVTVEELSACDLYSL